MRYEIIRGKYLDKNDLVVKTDKREYHLIKKYKMKKGSVSSTGKDDYLIYTIDTQECVGTGYSLDECIEMIKEFEM